MTKSDVTIVDALRIAVRWATVSESSDAAGHGAIRDLVAKNCRFADEPEHLEKFQLLVAELHYAFRIVKP